MFYKPDVRLNALSEVGLGYPCLAAGAESSLPRAKPCKILRGMCNSGGRHNRPDENQQLSRSMARGPGFLHGSEAQSCRLPDMHRMDESTAVYLPPKQDAPSLKASTNGWDFG
jgi:hypothetical protein